MNDCWQDLGNAIILQAVKDYRKAMRVLKRHPKYKGALEVKEEVEGFFESAWFGVISKVDGKTLLTRLQKEG